MKDAMNFLLPIVQEPMNDLTGKCISHHVSTNGYYGYQPVVGKTEGRSQQQNSLMERMDTCDDDIQFNNCMEPEEPETPRRDVLTNGANRKRAWEYEDCGSCKKRREVGLQKETENNLLEDLLRETHGSSSYHWLGHEI